MLYIFDSNNATELGGAIYATSSHQTEFIFSHQCFISHNSNRHPDNWTTLLTFENNRAKHGHAIFADTATTGICPQGFCNYKNYQKATIVRTCNKLIEENVCIDHRRGQLCGECEDGYTVYNHSENFKCGKCLYGALGILIYFFAELISHYCSC